MSWNDKRLETLVGVMLRTGVLLAAAVVLTGGVMYLVQNHGARPDYAHFTPEPAQFATLKGAATGFLTLEPRSIIMLGLLILIATPVARVLMCVIGFLMERDRLYVAVSSVVLAILLYSLLLHR
ncbi:MAG TPA: DUF1634 domain-containing protein [Acidobacteriaceae bacterium]|jgi:uncharacterized membrane protein|nr:DUF1634 domain-containing protein [Acidobacteriaceae bacterium]